MFWKKKKQQEDIILYDYYILAGEEKEICWCNLHYSEDVEDPLFLEICKELILTVLSKNTVVTYLEILKKQEDLSIIKFLETKSFPKDAYTFNGDQFVLKTHEANSILLEEYLKGAISSYKGYRSPRSFSLYGYQDETVFQNGFIEIDERVDKGLYDICILYEEPPQSLEFEIKKVCMNLDGLCDLVLSVCGKFGKKVNIVRES